MEHPDGFHVCVSTGERPRLVLRTLLSRDLPVTDAEAEETVLWPSGRSPAHP
jgi:hypothetical protein